MSDNSRGNTDFGGNRGFSFAVGSDDIPQEHWSDHDITEWCLTRGDREAKQKEIDERRARLHDWFDAKYALSRVQQPREEIAKQFDKLNAIVSSAKKGMSLSQAVAAYGQNGTVCPYCKCFRHWNTAAFS